MELNFERRRAEQLSGDMRLAGGGEIARFANVKVIDASGAEVTSVEAGSRVRISARVEALTRVERPIFGFQIVNADGLQIFAPPPTELDAEDRVLEAGASADFAFEFENPLASGHYYVHLALGRLAPGAEMVAFRKHAADFVVFGASPLRRPGRPRARAQVAHGREPTRDERPPSERSCARSAARRRFGGGTARFFDLLWLIVDDRVQARLPRHGARLRLVVRAAADALRRAARRLHAGVPVRRRRRELPGDAAPQHHALRPSSRRRPTRPSTSVVATRAWFARCSSRAW